MDLTCKTIYCNVRNTMSFLLIVVFTNLLIHNEVNAVEQGSVDSKYTTCSAENTFDHITNDDIRSFTEELLKRDNSSLFQFFKYNIQGKANKNPDVDEAPEPLLQVDDQALQYPTVANVIALLDNYYPDARDAEDVTDEERKEENQFLDSIMDTAVMNYTIDFLREKETIYVWFQGTILTLRFKWNDKMKKVGSFFIGTSPEFEVALYSVCFILRNNKKCQIRLNGSKLFVKTYSICNKDSKRVVGSVYAGN
ncbi:hypothetical protein LSTR_LSTR003927 [Laodelphax striatellus]|uniref:EndoU domain-containing protein n=1 Tax=Laodelphax striatellus TaxID=195883 RepID=A0A482X9G5_LAOST|nr:hypothetical protein LSTR_LSTR003927 [Laodelphax striatellus]